MQTRVSDPSEDRRPRSGSRIDALDVLRGLVMVLMAIDHSSGEFNRGRLFSDSAAFYHPHDPLPAAQFMTRWITHLCAPTFVFLAGTSLSLSIARRVASGERALSIDWHLFSRGAVIAGFELWVSFFWMPPGHYLFQVLYAIGTCFILMIPLRRLPTTAMVALGALLGVFGEALVGAVFVPPPGTTPLLAALLLVPGDHGSLIIGYPTLFWLSPMLLGWGFGRYLLTNPPPGAVMHRLVVGGVLSLALFVAVRGEDAYGNMRLLRDDGSVVQWLHVSKYPPSLTYLALELGCASLVLAALYALPANAFSPKNLLLVLGRTPMFFYLLHIPLLVGAAHALDLDHRAGLGATYLFGALVVCSLYPACLFYGRYKARHPNGIARYV
jgi:uncharacterized membrane protein